MNSARYFRVHRRRCHLYHDHDDRHLHYFCFPLLTIERMYCQQALRREQFLAVCFIGQRCIVNHCGIVNKICRLNYLMAKASIGWIYDEYFIE